MTTPEILPAPLSITLFGPLQVAVAGLPLPRLRSRKALWLLALLVLRAGRPVEREWLAGSLWPDVDQSAAAANLRVVLSELRRALGREGQRLQSPGRHTLLLELAGADVDVCAFDAAMTQQGQAALRQAVALYRGPLLEGCAEEWVGQERIVREQDCLNALEALAAASLAAGDSKTAVEYYRRAVGLDPWREGAHRGLMQALFQAGDANAALGVYQTFVRQLGKDDPRAVPDEQTTTLYMHLRAEVRRRVSAPPVRVAESAAPAAAGSLPQPLTELIGREAQQEEIAERLRHSRLVTLTGPGGIGKTRLALAVARETVSEYADGVWLVALDALSKGEQVTAEIARALKVKEKAGQALLANITTVLQGKHLLLLLDNCEHLLDAAADVTGHLLRECSGLRVLATSREALRIMGEAAWAVPGLVVPDPNRLSAGGATLLRVLPDYAGVQLFVQRAQAAQKGFTLTTENVRAVSLVCARLEGIPLALELAAARARAMTVTQIAARLDDHLALLTGGDRVAQPRQQTLRATLDWSYALLNGPEQRLLDCVSVFSGGWTLEASEAICSEPGTGPLLDLLTSLVDKSLVIFNESESAAGRYRLLEIVRQYAAERLAHRGQEEVFRVRHREWFLKVVEEADLPAAPPVEEEKSLRYLEKEHENLRAALAWSEKDPNGAEAGLRLASALWRFWSERSHYSEGRAFLVQALAREGAQGPTAARAQALKGAATLADRQGDYVLARTLYEQCLAVFRELGDRKEAGSALGSLNYLANRYGDAATAKVYYAEAKAHYEQNLILLAELDDKNGAARTYHFLGHLNYNQGHVASARTYHQKSLEIYRDTGDTGGIAIAYSCLFVVANHQGDYAAARSLQREGLEFFRKSGDNNGVAVALGNLGVIAHTQGNCVLARTYHEQSLEIFQMLGDKSGVVSASRNLILAVRDQGDYAEARALQAESILLCQEMGDRVELTNGLEGMAAVLLAQAETLRAVRLWSAARSLQAGRTMSLLPTEATEKEQYDLQVGQARRILGDEAFNAAWKDGQALTWEQAIACAVEDAVGEADGQIRAL